jgi:hypothetical protein
MKRTTSPPPPAQCTERFFARHFCFLKKYLAVRIRVKVKWEKSFLLNDKFPFYFFNSWAN